MLSTPRTEEAGYSSAGVVSKRGGDIESYVLGQIQ